MFTSIWEDIKREFQSGNMVTRLILVNIGVFIVVKLLWILFDHTNGGLYHDIIYFFSISSDWYLVLTRPWTIISNMFLHEGFMHILFNMLFLYWFGRIIGDLLGNHRILPLYLLGGIVGALTFFVSANLLAYGAGGNHYAMGASGAVMAIVAASGFLAPDYSVRLLFLGDVKLKYIVAALIFFDVVMTAGTNNTGGHFAHLGGAFFGWLFIFRLRQGHDLSASVNNFFTYMGNLLRINKTKGPKVAYRNPSLKRKAHAVSDSGDPIDMSHQEQLDEILDKIKRSGYDSLSAEEKEFLFDASKKK